VVEHDFWHERWETGRTRFHQGRPNPMLVRHHGALGQPGPGSVFAPLCGKAVDLAWLAGQGRSVVGVELSEVAVRDFFVEQGIDASHGQDGSFRVSEGGGVRLLCGDFFELGADQLGPVDGVYDRAALVALPEPMRQAYADHLLDLVPAEAPILLVTFEYPQGEADGPPFSVGPDAVRSLFGAGRRIEHLESVDVLAAMPDLASRGLSRLHEHAFAVTG
jgi:thiopurine S-methyltransferase